MLATSFVLHDVNAEQNAIRTSRVERRMRHSAWESSWVLGCSALGMGIVCVLSSMPRSAQNEITDKMESHRFKILLLKALQRCQKLGIIAIVPLFGFGGAFLTIGLGTVPFLTTLYSSDSTTAQIQMSAADYRYTRHLLMAGGLVLFIVLGRLVRQRVQWYCNTQVCSCCGYSLNGLVSRRCPECGTGF